MPIDDGTGVLVGEICEGCVRLRPLEGINPCPYGNSQWPDKKTFFVGEDGTPGSKCHKYVTFDDIGIEADMNKTMIKEASKMTNSKLNIELYKLVRALNEKERKKLYKYWDYLFPSEYANKMVDDTIDTGTKNKKRKKKTEHNKFDDGFKRKKGE